jgi:hypothetical protein
MKVNKTSKCYVMNPCACSYYRDVGEVLFVLSHRYLALRLRDYLADDGGYDAGAMHFFQ